MFDFNCKLGHWPYRPVKSLRALLDVMDRLGIGRAAVSSLNAVHYMNPQDGNDEVAAWTAPQRERLIPFAVVRPGFALWQEDLDVCLGVHGMRGVVLHPNYHRYTLDDPRLAPVMACAEQRGIPVCVQMGLEDARRQYDHEIIGDVPPEELRRFAETYPGVNVVALAVKLGQVRALGDTPPPSLHFDISNIETMGCLAPVLELLAAERLLFGTNFPLFNAQANVDKLAKSGISDAARQAIAEGNARRLLGL